MKPSLKTKGLILTSCLFLLAFILTSCGKEEEAPTQKPPTVTITSPMNFATYIQGDTIQFSATANDPEDGALSGDSLVWTSTIDGQFGTGTSFEKVISPGQHEITLTASDSEGAKGSETIKLIISSTIETK